MEQFYPIIKKTKEKFYPKKKKKKKKKRNKSDNQSHSYPDPPKKRKKKDILIRKERMEARASAHFLCHFHGSSCRLVICERTVWVCTKRRTPFSGCYGTIKTQLLLFIYLRRQFLVRIFSLSFIAIQYLNWVSMTLSFSSQILFFVLEK